MYKLSEKATEDIDSILDFSILNSGANLMLDYHESLEKCLDTLNENPDLGTEVDHIRPDYFCFYHRSHAIYYQIKKPILSAL